MKKLTKFTTKEVVKEVGKEIELPAYFCMSSKFLPSKAGKGDYFNSTVRLSDTDGNGQMISAVNIGENGGCISFGRSPFGVDEVLDKWTQVSESEWLAAVALLKADIDGGEVGNE